MSVRYVLDTDAVVDVLRGRRGVAGRLAQESPEDIAIASMTFAELLYGAQCAQDPAKSELAVRRFVEVVRVIPFSRSASEIHARLRFATRKNTVGPNDLVIAATAIAAQATIITGNMKEFSRLPDVKVENWRA